MNEGASVRGRCDDGKGDRQVVGTSACCGRRPPRSVTAQARVARTHVCAPQESLQRELRTARIPCISRLCVVIIPEISIRRNRAHLLSDRPRTRLPSKGALRDAARAQARFPSRQHCPRADAHPRGEARCGIASAAKPRTHVRSELMFRPLCGSPMPCVVMRLASRPEDRGGPRGPQIGMRRRA
jgi:hypothetical protein